MAAYSGGCYFYLSRCQDSPDAKNVVAFSMKPTQIASGFAYHYKRGAKTSILTIVILFNSL